MAFAALAFFCARAALGSSLYHSVLPGECNKFIGLALPNFFARGIVVKVVVFRNHAPVDAAPLISLAEANLEEIA